VTVASQDWTPAKIAQYDQALAGADKELDVLVQMLRIGTAKDGEHQALANIGAMLMKTEPAGLVGLVTAAIRHISKEA
jgi:hypothetical protein